MNAIKKKYQYIDWYSPEEMHEENAKWFSELNFARDEQLFLNDLVKAQTVLLTDAAVFEESKTLVTEILNREKEIVSLMKQVQAHQNRLEIMLDEPDQIIMEKAYTETHRELLLAVDRYLSEYRTVKRKLFDLVSRIMKKDKQNRLLT